MTRLTLPVFGKALLDSADLDPAYLAMYNANLDERTLRQLLLAYICFYSLGTAAKIAEAPTAKKFWLLMITAALNEGFRADGSKPWPRGAERRHFRGQQGVAAVSALIDRYKTASHAIDGFVGKPPYNFRSINSAAMSNRSVGEWMGFKVVDLAEQVLGYNVDVNDVAFAVYKDPRQGAALYRYGDKNAAISNSEVEQTIRDIVKLFPGYKAQPRRHRLLGPLEGETLACKWKSHMGGHYEPGKDTREIREGLHGWGDLAEQLASHLPKG